MLHAHTAWLLTNQATAAEFTSCSRFPAPRACLSRAAAVFQLLWLQLQQSSMMKLAVSFTVPAGAWQEWAVFDAGQELLLLSGTLL